MREHRRLAAAMAGEKTELTRVLRVIKTSAEIYCMESIRIWLNGKRNYDAGVKLYMQFGNDALLKKLFTERPSTSFKEKTLVESLQKLMVKTVEKKQEVMVQKGVYVERVSKEKVYDGGWSREMDEVERALHLRWKPGFIEMNELCIKIRPLAIEGKTNKQKQIEAGKMALKILDLEDECYQFYEQRDHYMKHGELPDQRPYGEPCIDPKLMPKKLDSHQRQLREQKLNLKKDPASVNAAKLIKKHEWFISYYKKELKID